MIMNKTRNSILAAVLVGSFLAGFASAATPTGNQRNHPLPYNPYVGPNPQSMPMNDNTRRPAPRRPMAIGTPHAPEIDRWLRARHEYPTGPYGTRVIKVAVSSKQINPANCRPKAHLEWQISQAISQCQGVDNQIARYTRSLWSISRSVHVSRAHYNAYANVLQQLQNLKFKREALVASRTKLQNSLRQINYKLRTTRGTQVIWHIHNHNKRTYVPTGYLQRKAVQYVTNNPSVIGTTVQLNF
jgi:hypothetical protein